MYQFVVLVDRYPYFCLFFFFLLPLLKNKDIKCVMSDSDAETRRDKRTV